MVIKSSRITESAFIIESLSNNLHTSNILEIIGIQEQLLIINRFYNDIIESNHIIESLNGPGNIFIRDINENVTIIEEAFPRVFLNNISEIAVPVETNNNNVAFDKLTIVETLTVSKAKLIKENLTIHETITNNFHSRLDVFETAVINEGLISYII